MPRAVIKASRAHLARVTGLPGTDQAGDIPGVDLSDAIARKHSVGAAEVGLAVGVPVGARVGRPADGDSAAAARPPGRGVPEHGDGRAVAEVPRPRRLSNAVEEVHGGLRIGLSPELGRYLTAANCGVQSQRRSGNAL
jgi:hypothetical protein